MPRKAPTPSTGTQRSRRFFQLFWSILNQSARTRRAERNAVSPEVMGQAMTPSMARAMPMPPMVLEQTSYTAVEPPPPRASSSSPV